MFFEELLLRSKRDASLAIRELVFFPRAMCVTTFLPILRATKFRNVLYSVTLNLTDTLTK